jgi:tetratricopeptide (TPR) repeat protein
MLYCDGPLCNPSAPRIQWRLDLLFGLPAGYRVGVPTIHTIDRRLPSQPREETLRLARNAVAGARVCLPAHGFLASVLLKLGRTEDAAEVVAQAEQLQPGVADAYDGLAFVSLALGHHEHANRLYRRATERAPGDPRFWYNLACSERSLGNLAEAESACNRAIALDPNQYPTYLMRSELRVQLQDSNHIAELSARLETHGTDYRARIFLGYALAKELDDLGRFEAAFRAFAAAASARRSRLDYKVMVDERKLARIAEVYATAATPAQDADGVDSSRYIFIVGLPRSGTTLVERILTGLPGVRSNGETDAFSRALMEAATGEGDVFARAAAANPHEVAAKYAIAAESGIAAKRVIEKLPLNYLYLSAIHSALPNARILLLRRSPLDSCFAMYRTLFANGYPFSYDLAELGRYYAAYERLVNHWRTTLGSAIYEVTYEDLVREPARVGAGIARHCGLPWDPSALEIEHNRAVSLTASAAQVRRPIYGSSSGRWRHYQAELRPLIDTLIKHGVSLPL